MKLIEFLMDYCESDQLIRIMYDDGEYIRYTEFETLFVSHFLSHPKTTKDLLESKIVLIGSYCGRSGVDGLDIHVKFEVKEKEENENRSR